MGKISKPLVLGNQASIAFIQRKIIVLSILTYICNTVKCFTNICDTVKCFVGKKLSTKICGANYVNRKNSHRTLFLNSNVI